MTSQITPPRPNHSNTNSTALGSIYKFLHLLHFSFNISLYILFYVYCNVFVRCKMLNIHQFNSKLIRVAVLSTFA